MGAGVIRGIAAELGWGGVMAAYLAASSSMPMFALSVTEARKAPLVLR